MEGEEHASVTVDPYSYTGGYDGDSDDQVTFVVDQRNPEGAAEGELHHDKSLVPAPAQSPAQSLSPAPAQSAAPARAPAAARAPAPAPPVPAAARAPAPAPLPEASSVANSVAEGTPSPHEDWQTHFEAVLSMPVGTPQEQLRKMQALRVLYDRFAQCCEVVCRTIATETQAQVPAEGLTHKRLTGKGVAGGLKFLAGNVFVKLSQDSAGIYGGDAAAAKAAKHELRSLKALVSCNLPELLLPLTAVVEYAGLCFLCQSRVEGLSDASLVLGSCDAGRTVCSRDPRMNALVGAACAHLNLGGHNTIARSTRSVRLLYGPADLEGHRLGIPDKENGNIQHKDRGNRRHKLLLLDFARLFPPEPPIDANGRGGRPVGRALWVSSDPSEPLRTLDGAGSVRRRARDALESARARKSAAVGEACRLMAVPCIEGVLLYDGALQTSAAVAAAAAASAAAAAGAGDRRSGVDGVALNARASDMAQRALYGPAVLLQDIGPVFFELMRPELVLAAPEPLSSDGFSGFGCCSDCFAQDRAVSCEHGAALHHADLRSSARRLHGTVLPTLAKRFDAREVAPSDSHGIARELHACGVNMRHLGELRNRCRNQSVRAFLLSEMVSRVLKAMVLGELRLARRAGGDWGTPNVGVAAGAEAGAEQLEAGAGAYHDEENAGEGQEAYDVVGEGQTAVQQQQQRSLQQQQHGHQQQRPAPHPYGRVLRIFNLLFGHGVASEQYWENDVKQALLYKFGPRALEEKRGDAEMCLRANVLRLPAFYRLQTDTGVRFTERVNEALFEAREPFPLQTPSTALSQLASSSSTGNDGDPANEHSEQCQPFGPWCIQGLGALVQCIDTEAELDTLLRQQAHREAGGQHQQEEQQSQQPTFAQAYLSAAEAVLGAHSPYTVQAMLVRAQELCLSRRMDEAAALADRARACSLTCEGGQRTLLYALACACEGDVYAACSSWTEALRCYSAALLRVRKLTSGQHPLQARLLASQASVCLRRGTHQRHSERGLRLLQRSSELYTALYGADIASLVASTVLLPGQGYSLAGQLAQLALSWQRALQRLPGDGGVDEERKQSEGGEYEGDSGGDEGWDEEEWGRQEPVQGPTASGALQVYHSVTRTLGVLEDLQGVPRGFFAGKSTRLSDEAHASVQDSRHGQPAAAGRAGDFAAAPGAEAAWEAGKVWTCVLRHPSAPHVCVQGPRGKLLPFVQQVSAGASGEYEFRVSFLPVAAGSYVLDWPEDTASPADRPAGSMTVRVHGGRVSAARCSLDEAALAHVTVGDTVRVSLHARDCFGNDTQVVSLADVFGGCVRNDRITRNLPTLSFSKPSGDQQQQGLLKCSFTATFAGDFRLHVTVAGVELNGCPKRFTINPATAEPRRCGAMVFMQQAGARMDSVAQYCVNCARQRKDKCFVCNSSLFGNGFPNMNRQPMLLCNRCSMIRKGCCVQCGGRVHHGGVKVERCHGCHAGVSSLPCVGTA